MPGAYLKLAFHDSRTIKLLIDGTANQACPDSSMPIVEYSVDKGPWKVKQPAKTEELYPLSLAEGLDAGGEHRAEIYFRAGNLGPKRWESSTVHLRIAGTQLDAGGSLVPIALRPQRAIGFGDSITEGVCVEGLCSYYDNLLMNNARITWFPIVCAALECEYGQLGTGGQGMVRTNIQIPPLPQTWDHYDATTSRLTNGLLLPEPDYVFCEMGTNDFEGDDRKRKQMDITAAYAGWLSAMRKACPHARFFCIVPPLGWHAAEVHAAVTFRNKAGDQKVDLIDTAPLKAGFRAGEGATTLAYDGVHPSVYGNAMLGALIAVEAQKMISHKD